MVPAEPRERLTPERITKGALALIDREGLPAFTLDRLGAEFGVSGEAIYKHVASKNQILDRVLSELLATLEPLREGEDVSAGVARFYRSLWGLFRSHPNVLAVLLARPLTLPVILDCTERNLAALKAAGVRPEAASLALHSLTAFTLGFSTLSASGYLDEVSTGPEANGSALSGGEQHQRLDIDAEFERALAMVLGCVKAHLD